MRQKILKPSKPHESGEGLDGAPTGAPVAVGVSTTGVGAVGTVGVVTTVGAFTGVVTTVGVWTGVVTTVGVLTGAGTAIGLRTGAVCLGILGDALGLCVCCIISMKQYKLEYDQKKCVSETTNLSYVYLTHRRNLDRNSPFRNESLTAEVNAKKLHSNNAATRD